MKKIILGALMAGIFVSSVSFAGSFYNPAEHRIAQVNRRWSVQPLCWHEQMDGHFKVVSNIEKICPVNCFVSFLDKELHNNSFIH